MAVLPIDQPFHIRLKGVDGGSGFVHGTENEDQANADAKRRNDQAEKLEIKARYVVVTK